MKHIWKGQTITEGKAVLFVKHISYIGRFKVLYMDIKKTQRQSMKKLIESQKVQFKTVHVRSKLDKRLKKAERINLYNDNNNHNKDNKTSRHTR